MAPGQTRAFLPNYVIYIAEIDILTDSSPDRPVTYDEIEAEERDFPHSLREEMEKAAGDIIRNIWESASDFQLRSLAASVYRVMRVHAP